MEPDNCTAMTLLRQFRYALTGEERAATSSNVEFIGSGHLASVFAVTDLAAAAVGIAALAIADLVAARWRQHTRVHIDRRLASMWFATSIRPQGWKVPPMRDPLSGDYRTIDGWIRIHANAPPHRAAALSVLDVAPDKEAVTQGVEGWTSDSLEAAIIEAGGCAATMHSCAEWAANPQGQAVANEPLLHVTPTSACAQVDWPGRTDRPLLGIRVLDRKSTRLNSSHLVISYAVFCLKKKNKQSHTNTHAPSNSPRITSTVCISGCASQELPLLH